MPFTLKQTDHLTSGGFVVHGSDGLDEITTTGSTLALELLDNWEIARKKFVKVFPTEYKRALSEMFVKRAVAAWERR